MREGYRYYTIPHYYKQTFGRANKRRVTDTILNHISINRKGL